MRTSVMNLFVNNPQNIHSTQLGPIAACKRKKRYFLTRKDDLAFVGVFLALFFPPFFLGSCYAF